MGGGRGLCPGEQTGILMVLILGLYLKVGRSWLAGRVWRKSCLSEDKSVERGALVRLCVIPGIMGSQGQVTSGIMGSQGQVKQRRDGSQWVKKKCWSGTFSFSPVSPLHLKCCCCCC